MAYRLDGVLGAANQGHSFVQYDDTETGRSRIIRAGPGADGNLLATDTPTALSIDALVPQERNLEVFTIFDVTITADFDDVREAVTEFGRQVNAADIDYGPIDNNSNRFTGDVFEAITSLEVRNSTDLDLPGFRGDLPVPQPQPLVHR